MLQQRPANYEPEVAGTSRDNGIAAEPETLVTRSTELRDADKGEAEQLETPRARFPTSSGVAPGL